MIFVTIDEPDSTLSVKAGELRLLLCHDIGIGDPVPFDQGERRILPGLASG